MEYGLTDIQEYYANTGAMVRAMDDIQGGTGKVPPMRDHVTTLFHVFDLSGPRPDLSPDSKQSRNLQYVIRCSNCANAVVIVLTWTNGLMQVQATVVESFSRAPRPKMIHAINRSVAVPILVRCNEFRFSTHDGVVILH